MIQLSPEPLDAAAFVRFGTVIRFEAAGARLINEGTARRADTAALFTQAAGLSPVMALYRPQPQALPLRLSLFERHPHSAQSFVALDVPRFLVVVAPAGPDGLPVASGARAFLGSASMGVSYLPDQWHTPLLAIGGGGDFLMVMAESGTAGDCIEHRLAAPLLVQDAAPLSGMTHDA